MADVVSVVSPEWWTVVASVAVEHKKVYGSLTPDVVWEVAASDKVEVCT